MIPADHVTAYLNAHYRPDVAANLLVAAQPLMALAWDEGRKHGATYPYGQRGLATDDNPYRTTK